MFFGRRTITNDDNGIVKFTDRPNLPVPMTTGEITWNISFEGFPTGTLTYTGLRKSDLPQFTAAYGGVSRGEKIPITLGEIDFIVDRFGYTLQPLPPNISDTGIYQVIVTLKSRLSEQLEQNVAVFSVVSRYATEISLSQLCRAVDVVYSGGDYKLSIPSEASKKYTVNPASVLNAIARINGCYISYRKGVTLKKINQGKKWTLGSEQVINHGEIYLSAPPVLKEVIVTNNFTDDTVNGLEEQFIVEKPQEFRLKEPVIDTLTDGDDDPELPPPDSKKLKSVDSNSIDGSGPKKVKRTLKTINGNPLRETIDIYGFRYLGNEINLPEGADPAPFWGKIESFTKDYNYQPAPSIRFRINATDFSNIGSYRVMVHPDYANIAQTDGLGREITFASSAKFLTSVVGSGWRYVRFEPEKNDVLETVRFEGESISDLYIFKKIPKQSATYYDLRTVNDRNNNNLPFTINWTPYDELPVRFQQLAGGDTITDRGLVGVLIPDANYVPPVYVFEEADTIFSLTTTPNPDPPAEDTPNILVAGEETYNSFQRTPIDNGYREKITEYSAQNSFFDVAENIRFRDVAGTLPVAESLVQEWEDVGRSPVGGSLTSSPVTYVANSDYINSNSKSGGSTSVAEATAIIEAEKALATELQIQTLKSSQGQKTIKWHYPTMQPGDYFSVRGEYFDETWRVTDCSWTLKYQGTNNSTGQLLVTNEGTAVTVGRHLPRSVAIAKENVTAAATGNNGAGGNINDEPRVSVQLISPQFNLSRVPVSGPSRRNF